MSLFDFLDPQASNLDQMRSLNSVGTGLDAGGQLFTGLTRFQFGNQQRQAADFAAAQDRQQASDAAASGQRAAWSADQTTKYITSAALASAAASGGGASDPTVMNVIAKTAAEGAYRKSVALYQGDEKQRQLNLQADASVYSGQLAQRQSYTAAATGMLGAATALFKGSARDSSILQRFGNGGPRSSGSSLSDPWAVNGPGE